METSNRWRLTEPQPCRRTRILLKQESTEAQRVDQNSAFRSFGVVRRNLSSLVALFLERRRGTKYGYGVFGGEGDELVVDRRNRDEGPYPMEEKKSKCKCNTK